MSLPHSDILRAFRRRWLATPTLVALVPGGLHHEDDEGGEDGATPNARLQVRHEAPEYHSGTAFVQKFLVTVTVWSAAGPVDAGRVEAAAQAAFARSARSALTLRGGRVLDLTRGDGDLEQDPERSRGRGVLVTALSWNVLVQGEG